VSFPGGESGPVLEEGDFFGEEALISGAVRSANVTMLEDGELASPTAHREAETAKAHRG